MLHLSRASLQNRKAWEEAGIRLPTYDISKVSEETVKHPQWVHIGPGNIFRGFVAALAQDLLDKKESSTGITVISTFDHEVFDKIYVPFENLALQVQMHGSGELEKAVIGSIGEAVKTDELNPEGWDRARIIFEDPNLQIVSFTITEKGYQIRDINGDFQPAIQADFSIHPLNAYPKMTMSIVAALLYSRFKAGAYPIALVSMDNFSHNGDKLKESVTTIANKWVENQLVEPEFLTYLTGEKVSFPWSMIDKITPRPDEQVSKHLNAIGFADTEIVITQFRTYIAPFVNAEAAQYLVIENDFPNGRPNFESIGVYITDRPTVDKVERMKVTTCLNPLHTAMSVTGCVLGYTKISDEMKDPAIVKLIKGVGEIEGMKVVVDPGIINPQAFLKEVVEERFPNPYMPDTPQRIATDTSQKVAVRFGNTIRSYMEREDLDPKTLKYIPFAVAGWCRYLLGLDDQGNEMELSADPMLNELQSYLKSIQFGKPESFSDQLKPILSNEQIFGVDLYKAGIGKIIEEDFKQMISGPGGTRKALENLVKES